MKTSITAVFILWYFHLLVFQIRKVYTSLETTFRSFQIKIACSTTSLFSNHQQKLLGKRKEPVIALKNVLRARACLKNLYRWLKSFLIFHWFVLLHYYNTTWTKYNFQYLLKRKLFQLFFLQSFWIATSSYLGHPLPLLLLFFIKFFQGKSRVYSDVFFYFWSLPSRKAKKLACVTKN